MNSSTLIIAVHAKVVIFKKMLRKRGKFDMIPMKQLVQLHTHGALSIKYEDGKPLATIGDTQIDANMAKNMCVNLGWTGFALSPFEIIEKTKNFTGSVKRFASDEIIENAQVEFLNKRSSEYGKTFDRIHIIMPRYFEISVLYKMPGNSASYVVYDSTTSVPVAKCKSIKQVCEYLDTLIK